jgi:hypothetical protein
MQHKATRVTLSEVPAIHMQHPLATHPVPPDDAVHLAVHTLKVMQDTLERDAMRVLGSAPPLHSRARHSAARTA